MSEPAPSRTGIGWDTHRVTMDPRRSLVLGGVRIESPYGLDGHSDADVLTHAVIDALLGAACLGDIGDHFPDTDERFRDADSLGLLRETVARCAQAGWRPVHADATVLLERPKLAGHKAEMAGRLAEALGVEPGCVNVKATRGEGMGPVGRGEGAVAMATVTCVPVR